MYCVFCGKPASQTAGARFCLYCGKALEGNTSATPPKSTNATQEIKVTAPSEPAYQWPEPATPPNNSAVAPSTALASTPAAEVYGPWGTTNPYNYNPNNLYGQPAQGYYNPPHGQYQQNTPPNHGQNYQPFGTQYQPYQGGQANMPPNPNVYSYNPYYSIEQQRFVQPRPLRRYALDKNVRAARNLAITASVIGFAMYPLLAVLSRSSYYYGNQMGRNIFGIILGFIAAGVVEKSPKAGGVMLIFAGFLSLAAAPFGLVGAIMCFIAAILALTTPPKP